VEDVAAGEARGEAHPESAVGAKVNWQRDPRRVLMMMIIRIGIVMAGRGELWRVLMLMRISIRIGIVIAGRGELRVQGGTVPRVSPLLMMMSIRIGIVIAGRDEL